jgi:voltage-gated potassium channel
MIKQNINHILEKGAHGTKANLIFDYFIMTLIVLNVLAISIDTIKDLDVDFLRYLHYFEVASVIVFTLEYLLRLYISNLTHPSSSALLSGKKFIFSFFGLIDLLAILPFYLPLLFVFDLRFIRLLRLFRLLRLLKLNRYNNSLNLIWVVIKEKRAELSMTGFVALLVLIIAAFLMYYVEGDVQPDKFSNVFASFWWAIATLTTVGYGDVYPITVVGKIISGTIAVLGIGIVALPTGIISAGFMFKVGKKDKLACSHCGK